MLNACGFDYFVDNQMFKNEEQYRTGAEIKCLAGIDPNQDLYLGVKPPWPDELIADDDQVDLARPEIEHFFVKKKLPFRINGKDLESNRQYISGRLIRAIGHIPDSQQLFLRVRRPGEDELIQDETLVDLAATGPEYFYSQEVSLKVVLIVNGREKIWGEKKITYEQAIHLAYGNIQEKATRIYTVTFKKGPRENPQGSMVKGDSIFVKNKMLFNVSATDKS